MKKIIFIGLLNLIFTFSFAQIDIELIKKNVTENPKQNFYNLLETFNSNPESLTQEQLNQLYFGSKFLKLEYSIGNYNQDYKKLWKQAEKKISKSKAEKIEIETESKYHKYPFMNEILNNMINVYTALGNNEKIKICLTQISAIENTIEKSGDGKTEETAICVIRPGDVISMLRNVGSSGFDQQQKTLKDGSIMTIYTINGEKKYIKLVGGFF